VIDLSRYVFEALRKDEEFILYRGQNEEDLSRVLVLAPAIEEPRPESLKRLEHEFSLKEDLDPAWAARPTAITFHWNRPVLALEDPGGIPLDQLLGPARNASRSDAGGQASDVGLFLRRAIGPRLATCIGAAWSTRTLSPLISW
jgi:hypothetical protein